jgi:hypothetical protein
MNIPPSSIFPASAFALVLRVSRQAVFKMLDGISPAGAIERGGRLVSAWSVSDLPASMQVRLCEIAEQKGCRNAEHALADAPKRWSPELPLNKVAAPSVERAMKVREALRPALLTMDTGAVSVAEFERRGLADYERVFGFAISARHFRRIIQRVLDRDRGFSEWDRLELYLDERPAAQTLTARHGKMPEVDWSDLDHSIELYHTAEESEGARRAQLWTAVCTWLDEHTEEGNPSARGGKALVLDYLSARAPFLAKNRDSLRELLRLKYARWKNGDGRPSSIRDLRGERSGHRRAVAITEEDKKMLLARALQYGGGLSQAWRELQREEKLSPAILAFYPFDPARKSHVPRAVRAQLKQDIKILKPHVHGPRNVRASGPFVGRDPSAMKSGDWFQADDLTAPVYFYDEDSPFEPKRGQILLMIDFRALYCLGFVLIAEPNYSAFDIRNLITTVHDAYGLPRGGFYFENGIWRKSRLLHGRRDDVDWTETEMGLREFVQFRHAKEARGKVVEGIFGILQNTMGLERGYVGRDERHDKYEHVQKQLTAIRARRAHASEFLYERAEWAARFEQIVELYNNEVQNGKYLPGLSPRQGYEQYFGAEGLTRLPTHCRYILSQHRIPTTVGRNGISFRFGKNLFRYKNEDTGRLLGQSVLAWFNPENPAVLHVTDRDRQFLCSVERDDDIPAMDATPEDLDAAMSRNASHLAYGRRLFRSIRPLFSDAFISRMSARVVVDNATPELGHRMKSQESAVDAQKVDGKRRESEAARILNSYGSLNGTTPAARSIGRRRGEYDGLVQMNKALERLESKSPSTESLSP